MVAEVEAYGRPPPVQKCWWTPSPRSWRTRGALRALATGDQRALQDGAQLLALRETEPALDALILRLIAGSEQEVLVSAAITGMLDRTKHAIFLVHTQKLLGSDCLNLTIMPIDNRDKNQVYLP
jgi:hypothetical protein